MKALVLIFKRALIPLLIALTCALLGLSCSPGTFDKEHRSKWNNWYLFIEQDHPERIYVFHNKERQNALEKIACGKVLPEANGERFTVNLENSPVSVSSVYDLQQPVFYLSDANLEEQHWQRAEGEYILPGAKLSTPENGFYQLSISEDLQ